ncbi:pyridoxamine 5'-phosphate oxidase family protein [Microlunatus panaciterrae]|uniref:Nitroimidazol reductase NimA-like FMN-containing flavoprotein (Pyridoxamine 5'-phosphate oxidase superfamily) n=1 Tax=Microlunatus panaciterrae TaxID=400768 RepID=A0ABS2RIL0_9ACTN|nr:pyridoxamine 5'-phosphate oxidase family protein [Microlunatus panaciterrae]MBM7798834.1 nitroimidazol reductase NimA-like FMN-containing flavoprotein (pyridoxamine 5'-phosphate oxidase superfamily) [Microlunatus panaciterrae]
MPSSRTATKTPSPGRRPLDPRTCRALLASQREGRLGYTSGRGHRAVPVHYKTEDGYIFLRTADYNEIAQYAPGAKVSFDLTHRADEAHEGWEIHVVGVAEPLEEEPEVDDEEPEAWPAGVRALALRIPVTEITGVEIAAH